MLDKDQYNQDEYNDYYAQETRGAEILGNKNRDSGGKKIVVILLLLTLITMGVYFGWKSMSSPNNEVNSSSSIVKDTPSEVNSSSIKNQSREDTKEKKEESKVTKEVESAITSSGTESGKMNPEDIANIVQMVMQKMNQEKTKESKSEDKSSIDSKSSEEQMQDNKLMESLSQTEVDSLSSDIDTVNSISEKDNTQKALSTETTDTYNKVVLPKDKISNNQSDELSKLSDDISHIIEEDNSKINSKYVEGVKKEVKSRKKEMRYIIVKKGDTLGKIAKRVYGNVMDYKKIYRANPDILRRPDRIHVGQKLRVPE